MKYYTWAAHKENDLTITFTRVNIHVIIKSVMKTYSTRIIKLIFYLIILECSSVHDLINKGIMI